MKHVNGFACRFGCGYRQMAHLGKYGMQGREIGLTYINQRMGATDLMFIEKLDKRL
jgi:hypothetical protein